MNDKETKVCTDCHKEKCLLNFPRNGKYYKSYCKDCLNIRNKNWPSYKKRIERNAGNKEVWKWKNKSVRFIRLVKVTKGCMVCGLREYECLDLHHVEPSEKEYNPSSLAGKSMNKIKEELRKCVVLCANHHRLVHAGKINLKDY